MNRQGRASHRGQVDMPKRSERRRDRRDRGKGNRNRDSKRGRGGGGRSRRGEDGPLGLTGWLDRIPLWATLSLYALVTVLLFREFIFSDLMLYGSDTLALGYMARAFFADALQTTGFPLWNPIILGGTPFLESLAGGDSLHPVSVGLLMVTETYRALGWKLVVHVFLAGVGMYAWLRALDLSRGASMVGGLAFLLAPYMVTLAFPGHDGKIFVTAMAPLLFWAMEWFLDRRGVLPLAAMAAIIALVILSTHFQMAYFLFGAAGAYMLFRCIQLGRGESGEGWKPAASTFGAFLTFSLLGAGVTAVQLVPAVDYVTEHSRRAATTLQAEGPEAIAYSSSWSLHPEEVASLAVPEFVGSSVGTREWTRDTYWGRNPFKLNHEYLGLVVLLLAALAFTGGPRAGLRWFMAGMGTVVLLFSLGANTPVWRVFYEVVPGISLFRAPSMAIFLTGFAAVTLAAMGVDRGAQLLEGGEGKRVWQVLLGAAGVLALGWGLAATGLLTSLWTTILYPGMTPAKADALQNALPHIQRGFGIAVVLAALVAALWWSVDRRFFPAALLVPALALLVTADQWRVNTAFIEVLDYRAFAAADENIRFLQDRQARESPFRVLSMVQGGQDVAPGMHGLELAGGHHPNDLGRYRDLIGMEGGGLPEHLVNFHPNVMGILNIRYLIWPDAQYGSLEGTQPVSQVSLPDGRVARSVHAFQTLPRARVVGEALVVDENRTMEAVLDIDGYDPARQVVLEEEPPLEPGGPHVQGRVEWLERTPDYLRFRVEADGPALVVLSENWFPAWRATVDGMETPVLRADHTLRAIAVPEGEHEVEFYYESPVLRAGLGISLLSILLLVGVVGVELVIRRRERA